MCKKLHSFGDHRHNNTDQESPKNWTEIRQVVFKPVESTNVGQIKYSATMTGVDDGIEPDSIWQGLHNYIIDFIVNDHALCFKVNGANCFIVTILLFTSIVPLLGAMA